MKTVIVTGAAGGMGRAVCRNLSDKGYNIFALDIRPVGIKGVREYNCDITDFESVKKAEIEFLKYYRKVDYIVHAAGIYDLDSLTEIDEKRFTRIFQINLFGVFRINKVFTPHMKKGGRITIITSELAPLNPLPFTGVYAITKSALEKYAYSLRSELSLRNISVSIIRPGAVRTGLLGDPTSALDRFVSKTEYYRPNAVNFKRIVDSIEAKSVEPEKIAHLVYRSISDNNPKFVYNINRNVLLRLMSALPDHLQLNILHLILK